MYMLFLSCMVLKNVLSSGGAGYKDVKYLWLLIKCSSIHLPLLLSSA